MRSFRRISMVVAIGLCLVFVGFELHTLTMDDLNEVALFQFLQATTLQLTQLPTMQPSLHPTLQLTQLPTMQPSLHPTLQLTQLPTSQLPSLQSTKLPTLSPTPLTDAQCLAMIPAPETSRPILNWESCSETIPAKLLESYEELQTTITINTTKHRVHLLTGGNWGQLCNKMGIFAALFHNMTLTYSARDMRNMLVALSSVYSPTAWALDLTALSSTVHGVLMDCVQCNALMPLSSLRCNSVIIKGKVYNVSYQLFPVFAESYVSPLYHNLRPKEIGYLNELNTVIQPKLALQHLVERKMKSKFPQKQTASVGIHQRNMDGECLTWIGDYVEYNCHPKRNLTKYWHIMGILEYWNEDEQFTFWQEVDMNFEWLHNMSDSTRNALETKYPLIMACNYSLSENQANILRREWPIMFSKRQPLEILLATDNQTPEGEKIMRTIDFGNVHKLEDYETCFVDMDFQYMLADMIALSLTDLHIGNPLSSCDDIIVHWRKARGKQTGTSFPQGCYDEYYKQQSVDLT